MTSVKRLTPAELRQFERQFAEWQEQKGGRSKEEEALVQACMARLPTAEERRLKKLIAKSEGGALSSDELEDYRSLVRRAERLDATRLTALMQLSRRWGQPCRPSWRPSDGRAEGMRGKAIPRSLRKLVRDRAGNRCEYWRHPASYSCAAFACEHVHPRARGAGNTMAELAWACPSCNSHKYDKTHARDTRSGRVVPLFNPRGQRWSRHFAWSEDFLLVLGRTATGRATVQALCLNRLEAVNLRRALAAIGEHPPDAD
jgi:5-methylcytosine-specific restriction endonuclease McrA